MFFGGKVCFQSFNFFFILQCNALNKYSYQTISSVFAVYSPFEAKFQCILGYLNVPLRKKAGLSWKELSVLQLAE